MKNGCLIEKMKRLYRKVIGMLRKHQNQSIHYIGGTEVLPSPLSKAEEEILMKELVKFEDDKEKIQEIKTTLIEHNIRLVVFIARKFENTGIHMEDLTSIGAIGLIKAINTFNPNKKTKLATYASRCIQNEILMYLRRTNKQKGEVSIDEPINSDCDGNELLISDTIGTDPDIVSHNLEEEMDKKLLKQALLKLSEREREIVELRFGFRTPYGKDKTQKEVADILGISQSYISRLEKKIILKLKKEINRMS